MQTIQAETVNHNFERVDEKLVVNHDQSPTGRQIFIAFTRIVVVSIARLVSQVEVTY